MALCDGRLERFIRDAHWNELNALPPVRRAVRKFALSLEHLTLEVRQDDEIAGWFRFDGEDCPRRPFDDEAIDEKTRAVMDAPERFGSRANVDRGHTLVDYGEILRVGLRGCEEKLDHALMETPRDEHLLAMKASLEAVRAFTRRMADSLAEKMTAASAGDRPRLVRMRDMLLRVPYEPARTFYEAVQSVWIIHFLLPLSDNAWYSISLGRFDRYMLPYYEEALRSGVDEAEIRRVLHHFWLLLNAYADGACLLNVGPDYNALSRLLIACQKDFALPAPILGARVSDETTQSDWDALVDERLFAMGQPTFYGEASCVRALIEKGVPEKEARGFSNNSCMGIGLPGREFNSMWGLVFMVSAAVETALNEGRLLSGEMLVSGIGAAYSLEEAFGNVERCAAQLIGIGLEAYEARAEYSERVEPNPFISLLTKSCIDRRCDRISGADYHNVTVECMGLADAADALCAVDRLVFQSGRFTLSQLSEAVRADFEGYEALRRALLACPKFGRDEAAAPYAVRLAGILQRLIRAHDHGNRRYSPSLHTLDANVGYGACGGAGYDGRLSGAPFAKNAGISNAARSADPTAMALASSALPQYAFYGGQPLDVSFSPDTVRMHAQEIEALIRVYLERGGLQFQVNALSGATLRAAVAHPEKYSGLVVRIGGFSTYFRNLSPASQRELIERVEREGNA